MSYDDNGQLVRREKSTGETTEYEWNDQGMLVKVILPNGEPVEYFYDGNRRLTGRKSADGVDHFVQSGWDIVTKMDDVGKRTYYTGSSAIEDRESVKYFHYNHRGDTVLVTDANGEILHNLNYEAYGKPTNNEGIPINTLSLSNITAPNNNTYSTGNTTGGSGNNLPNLFVGASGIRNDTKTNLHYMRFRWFSGEQMRFISADLLMDLNRYAYVSGDPINNIDPMGLWKVFPYNGRVYAIPTASGNTAKYLVSKGYKPSQININNYSMGTYSFPVYDITNALPPLIIQALREQEERNNASTGSAIDKTYVCAELVFAVYYILGYRPSNTKGKLIDSGDNPHDLGRRHPEINMAIFVADCTAPRLSRQISC